MLRCLLSSMCAAALQLTTMGNELAVLDWNQLPPLPDAIGVAAPYAGVSGNALLVAGGANFPDRMPWEGGTKTWHDRIWVLEKPDGSWREAGKLPRPLAYGVSVTHRNSVICVGGSNATRHYADTFRLTWTNGSLTTDPLASLPIALSGSAGAITGDTLFVAGGAEQPGEQAATNRAFALDLSAPSPAWTELPPLPSARILAVAAAHDGAFYVFGGANVVTTPEGKAKRQYLQEAWCYRSTHGWKRLADLPKPVLAAPSSAPFIGGSFLLLAGDDGSRAGFQPLDKHPGFPKGILAYDPSLDRWSDAGETPAPRATVPCVEWRGGFAIPSGEVRPGVRSPEVWTLR